MYLPSDDEVRALVQANPSGMTLEQIGMILGVTRERVAQIEERGLEKVCLKLYSRYRIRSIGDVLNKV